MTSDAALPGRTAGDRLRRARISEAAAGFEDSAPVGWLKRSGASVTDALRSWHDGKLADTPAGRAWDAVQLPVTAGSEALRQLNAMGGPIGPVLRTLDGYLVLVAVGAASDWDLPGVSIISDGETVRIPHPVVRDPYEHDGRTWVNAPRDDIAESLTDADDLYGAYICAAAFMNGPGALG